MAEQPEQAPKERMLPINLWWFPSVRLSAKDYDWGATAKGALYQVERYLNGIILEWNRIVESSDRQWKLVLGAPGSTPDLTLHAQFTDIQQLDLHFYLICWNRVHEFLGLFATEQNDEKVNEILRGISHTLEKASKARHHFEHLHQRQAGFIYPTKGGYANTLEGGQFGFSYVENSRGRREKVEKQVDLGRREVVALISTYADILRHYRAVVPDFTV